MWERQLASKIQSRIFQVDYFKNYKLQLLFNTRNKIHLIDRNGNYVKAYPVKLKSPATNPISVFDYDHNKEYRILIASKDKKISLYNIRGEKIPEWKFEKTKSTVKSEIQHFAHENKDYLIFSDEQKTYILNRRGEERVKPDLNFASSENSKFYLYKNHQNNGGKFVTTGISGKLYFTDLEGHVTTKKLENYSENHYFVFDDFDGDNTPQYIFADKNTVSIYNLDETKIFSESIENEITESPVVYMFSSGNKKIGFFSKENRKLYL